MDVPNPFPAGYWWQEFWRLYRYCIIGGLIGVPAGRVIHTERSGRIRREELRRILIDLRRSTAELEGASLEQARDSLRDEPRSYFAPDDPEGDSDLYLPVESSEIDEDLSLAFNPETSVPTEGSYDSAICAVPFDNLSKE
jgi:hypothetical protein